MTLSPSRIAAPRAPAAPPAFRFPFVASIAPVVIAVAIWAFTGSVFALIFAALGPVTAIASFVDSRVGGRTAKRREYARFEREVASARQLIEAAHDQEASAIAELAPDANSIITRRSADPNRWAGGHDSAVIVSLGVGSTRSEVSVDGASTAHPHSDTEKALSQLAHEASTLDAPILADARLGLALCGPPSLTASWARAAVVQLAWALAPDRYWYRRAEHPELAWMDALPHAREPGAPGRGALVEFGLESDPAPLIQLATAPDQARAAQSCRVIVATDSDGVPTVVEHPDRAARQPVSIVALTREDAYDWALRVRAEAVRDGRLVASSGVPDRADLAQLLDRATPAGGLAAPVGCSAAGDVILDLVVDGPHAVIGGTTGSGKSELLIGWVLSMAAMHSPAEVNFLLVDFKGGAAFAALETLPHTVGTITDLDEQTARRALDSLRAELKFRERELALAGARSVDDHDGLTRLVIVVDEFQAMLADYPELHTLFSDIAARGRSLGVHLILCTQRPGGVVRDGVLANADLRISLRVNNHSDSSAVVGADDAARIPATARGRAIVRMGGDTPVPVQFALAGPALAGRVIDAWPGVAEPRRPWCEPLPTRIVARDLPDVAEGVAFGLLDLPDEQRQDVAVWTPASGHLLIAGGPRSGKTAALATIAAACSDSLVMPNEPDLAWDVLTSLTERPEAVTFIIDDLDSLLARFPSDYRLEFVDRLTSLLRDGGARGITCAISTARLGAELSSIGGLFPHRLMLAQPSRNEHVLAGGEGSDFRPGLPPGGGTWHGSRVQVALAGHPLVPARVQQAPLVPSGALAIVTTRPAVVSRALSTDPANELITLDRDVESAIATARGRPVVIADVDQWQANWGALGALRSVATVVIHACSQADFRALTRSRELPPPLSNGDVGACWMLDDAGGARRARLPLPSPS